MWLDHWRQVTLPLVGVYTEVACALSLLKSFRVEVTLKLKPKLVFEVCEKPSRCPVNAVPA